MKKTVSFTQFKPDKNSPLALHLQLADELLKQLRALSPDVDYVLPSERTLVKELEINRMTVHRAYSCLLEKNLVVKNPDRSLSVTKTARKQLQGSFPVIGIVLPEKFSLYARRPMSLEYLKGIIDRATESGISTIMLTPPEPGCPADVADDFIQTQCAKLSGIIHLGSRGQDNDNVLQKILDYTGVPQLFISGHSSKPHIGSIGIDVAAGIDTLCRKIKEHGLKKIEIIARTMPRNNGSNYFTYNYTHRVEQAKTIFEAHGFEISGTETFSTPEEIKVNTDQLPDVFWCYNDEYASGLLAFLKANNVRVPEDVMVAGFDGFDANFEGSRITTIDHRIYDIGYYSVDLILEYYEFGVTEQNRTRMLEARLISGDTL